MPISRRLTLALLLSLLMHALLLSLTFGGQGLGLPGFDVPWGERRFEVPDLRVVLMQTQVTVAAQAGAPVNPPQRASIEQTVTDVPALKPSQVPSKIPASAPDGRSSIAKDPADGTGCAGSKERTRRCHQRGCSDHAAPNPCNRRNCRRTIRDTHIRRAPATFCAAGGSRKIGGCEI
jgi:hypothetical protein